MFLAYLVLLVTIFSLRAITKLKQQLAAERNTNKCYVQKGKSLELMFRERIARTWIVGKQFPRRLGVNASPQLKMARREKPEIFHFEVEWDGPVEFVRVNGPADMVITRL